MLGKSNMGNPTRHLRKISVTDITVKTAPEFLNKTKKEDTKAKLISLSISVGKNLPVLTLLFRSYGTEANQSGRQSK